MSIMKIYSFIALKQFIKMQRINFEALQTRIKMKVTSCILKVVLQEIAVYKQAKCYAINLMRNYNQDCLVCCISVKINCSITWFSQLYTLNFIRILSFIQLTFTVKSILYQHSLFASRQIVSQNLCTEISVFVISGFLLHLKLLF